MAHHLSIKTLRKQAKRTQKEMAELFDISLDTWRRWENNPDDMPYSAHLQAVDFLEQAVQIRKENTMAKHWGKVHMAEGPVNMHVEDQGYTVPIPEGLTEVFEPSQPVTDRQTLDYELYGKEPYPGYADEMEAWEEAWEQVNRAQMVADGAPLNIMDPVLADPEFDEFGEPIVYAGEPQIVVRDDGSIDAYDPDDIIHDDEESEEH